MALKKMVWFKSKGKKWRIIEHEGGQLWLIENICARLPPVLPPPPRQPIEIRLTEEDKKACRRHALGILETVGYYEDRNQRDLSKVETQVYDGKMGEVALSRYIGEPVDFKIYPKGKKKFGPDVGQYGCKTCSKKSAKDWNKGIPSWVWQYSDNNNNEKSHDPIRESTYLVLETGSMLYEIRYLMTPDQIKAALTEPDAEWLKKTKRVVREQDIPEECRLWREL